MKVDRDLKIALCDLWSSGVSWNRRYVSGEHHKREREGDRTAEEGETTRVCAWRVWNRGYDRDERRRGSRSPLLLGSREGPSSRLGSDIGVGNGMYYGKGVVGDRRDDSDRGMFHLCLRSPVEVG